MRVIRWSQEFSALRHTSEDTAISGAPVPTARKVLRAAIKGPVPETPLGEVLSRLGSTAEAHLRLIVWCKDCRHKVEPDPAEMAERYGAETTVPDWGKRLVCSQCGSRDVSFVVSGTKRDPLRGRLSSPSIRGLRQTRPFYRPF